MKNAMISSSVKKYGWAGVGGCSLPDGIRYALMPRAALFQFPRVGFGVSEVTRDLHADGIHGVMTDYEEKFHNLGTPINRCVGTMGPLPEVPEPPAEE